ncbi:hypothetical protein Ddye_015624 [Dipteronia dyeriana]|uniref:Uncharacterized protein n=1 Tax=Dipteronia dyeriana TaxID=168575 RepID=A0AAD9WZQ2_9ROSI|nr:hypothetical protein Ddye_015623 [Dipteronia dyeriana]KAK2648135.1 hypothetical protein Ddye_015624 [Dipteronia dyeriana]
MVYGDKPLIPNVEIEAVLTVTPFKQTDPRQTRRVLVTDPVGSGIFCRCLNIVVYYKKVAEEDSGWIVAGWIKESLGRVLADQPMLSGRLRRTSSEDIGELEIVSNDSGVRLIEAKIPITLSQFLDHQLKETSEESDALFVFWNDVDDQNPQFSPLFYLQVTNFECGGYSIGISCNLLLADILFKENFFQKWADVHKDIVSKSNSPKNPIFYFPNLKKDGCKSADSSISSNQIKNNDHTVIFNITDENLYSLDKESDKQIILASVEEVEREVGSKMASKFPVYLRESSNKIKIENCTKNVDQDQQLELIKKSTHEVSRGSWDDLGASEVDFGQGKKPDRVTYWIGSISDGVVVATPSTSGLNIIVSVPT